MKGSNHGVTKETHRPHSLPERLHSSLQEGGKAREAWNHHSPGGEKEISGRKDGLVLVPFK